MADKSKKNVVLYGVDPALTIAMKEELAGQARVTVQHPQYFDDVALKCDGVIILGDYPKIVEVYEEAEIDVEVVPLPSDDDDDEKPLTKTAIKSLGDEELDELLKAHGVEDPQGNLGEKRDQLIKIVFVGGE